MLDWLRDEERATGPKGRITFAVSAPMTQPLKEAIGELGENAWRLYREDGEAWWECATVDYPPAEKGRREPLRYIAIRIQRKQGELFGDGSPAKYYAVATNEWDWKPRRLLDWHRQKAGSIEALHDVHKNELAAGVLPCGRFGANAAWLRLAALTQLALPPERLRARPKRLRFLVVRSRANSYATHGG